MQPLDVLRYGQAAVDELIDRLTPADWNVTAVGTWTTKDLVGHLGAFEVRFAEVVALFAGSEPATNLRASSPTTFNDDQAAIRAGWSIADILAEFRDAHHLTMSLVDRIPAATWREAGTIPWYGAGYSLDDLVVYTMYGHKREHGPQLEAVLERSVA